MRVLGVAVAVVAVAVAAAVVVVPQRDPHPHEGGTPDASAAHPAPARPFDVRGTDLAEAAVLRAWDRRRAAAWAAGDERRLRRLYAPGSRAGTADARLLAGYRARGVTVRGLRMQVLAVTVLDRAPGRLRLRVIDRVAAATAVRGGRRSTLPRDAATTHVVLLVRGPTGPWRVASVTPG